MLRSKTLLLQIFKFPLKIYYFISKILFPIFLLFFFSTLEKQLIAQKQAKCKDNSIIKFRHKVNCKDPFTDYDFKSDCGTACKQNQYCFAYDRTKSAPICTFCFGEDNFIDITEEENYDLATFYEEKCPRKICPAYYLFPTCLHIWEMFGKRKTSTDSGKRSNKKNFNFNECLQFCLQMKGCIGFELNEIEKKDCQIIYYKRGILNDSKQFTYYGLKDCKDIDTSICLNTSKHLLTSLTSTLNDVNSIKVDLMTISKKGGVLITEANILEIITQDSTKNPFSEIEDERKLKHTLGIYIIVGCFILLIMGLLMSISVFYGMKKKRSNKGEKTIDSKMISSKDGTHGAAGGTAREKVVKKKAAKFTGGRAI